jgi:hypothetical protein
MLRVTTASPRSSPAAAINPSVTGSAWFGDERPRGDICCAKEVVAGDACVAFRQTNDVELKLRIHRGVLVLFRRSRLKIRQAQIRELGEGAVVEMMPREEKQQPMNAVCDSADCRANKQAEYEYPHRPNQDSPDQ